MGNTYKEYFEAAQKKKGIVRAVKMAPSRGQRQRTSQQEKKPKLTKASRPLMAFLFFGFLISGSGAFFLDEITRFLSRFEVSIFPSAAAEEKASSVTEKKEKASEGAETKSGSAGSSSAEGEAPVSATTTSSDELGHLSHLRDRKKELDLREEELNKMEAALNAQREEVEKKLVELEDVRRKISSVLEEKVQADDQKIENLVQFYSSMKAPQAAKIIETIDEDLAVKVMARMKKKTAADIMNLLRPEKAQTISEKYVGYRK